MAKKATKSPAAKSPAAKALRRGTARRVTPALLPVTTQAPVQPEPTETGSLTYNPGPGDSEMTVAFGKTFTAGKSVAVDDPKVYRKLSGNPLFSTGKREAKQGEDKDVAALVQAREKATEEATKAREKADEMRADADAKERAQRALDSLRDAKADPDQNPPITNHPVNR